VQDEIFDVVNERDEVVGQLARKEVHRQGLKHRAVHVFIFNARGELFLQKRSLKKDNHPGVWDSSAAGHVDTGEEYDVCAMREVQEELGIKLPCVPQRVLRVNACEETGQEFVWVYRCEHEGPFQLHPEEIDTGAWFTQEKIRSWMQESPEDFAPAFVCIWGQLFRN
jgi:isopentenyl-diphosphate delta-isomerase type 1